MMIPLKSVEFWRDLRGPGPRNQSEMTSGYSTMKVKAGESEPSSTDLLIFWHPPGQVVFLVKRGAKDDPVVAYGWHEVRRAIPVDPADVGIKPEDLAASKPEEKKEGAQKKA